MANRTGVNHFQAKDYDVIVVGGGMAGVCAAMAAARHHARTLLVQNRSVLGGNCSSEIRMHIVGAGCHMAKPNQAEAGILEELLLENKNLNTAQSFSIWDTILLQKVRQTENLDILLNTNMNGVTVENDQITAISCHQTTTEMDFRLSSRIFIDATGHGTLGFLAGAEARTGSEAKATYQERDAPDEANEFTMGNTLMFQAVRRGEPVRFKKPFWAYSFSEDDLQHRRHYNSVIALGENGEPVAFSSGKLNALPEYSVLDAGYWWIELGGQSEDIIADGEIIRDELLKCVYGVWDHIKNGGNHGAENYDLVWVGMVPGYRESRRLVGDYILTENDVLDSRMFDDAISYGGWPMDEHVPGGILDFEKLPSRIFNFEGIYTIPYRCYYSKNIGNLMMAGRDISTSKMAFGSTRVMGTCAVGGQAVGTAAALAIQYGCTVRDVKSHIRELQQILLKDDHYIPGCLNEDAADLARVAKVSATSHRPGFEPELVINGLTRPTDDNSNCWESAKIGPLGESLTLRLSKASEISEVRITFDPNLNRDIMPTIISKIRDLQVKELPEELVKDYDVTLFKNQNIVDVQSVRGNYQRLNSVKFAPTIADTVQITVRSTYGHPTARIYEARIYS